MQRRILIFCFILLIPNLSFAQAKVSVYKNVNKTKYTPKLPNFFDNEKPRGELISVGQIVAKKDNENDSSSDDSFSATPNPEKPLMGNPLGLIPKRKITQAVAQEQAPQEAPTGEKDATTSELEAAVTEAKNVAEQIRKSVGNNVDYSNTKDLSNVIDASQKALQRGQLSRPNQNKETQEDYQF